MLSLNSVGKGSSLLRSRRVLAARRYQSQYARWNRTANTTQMAAPNRRAGNMMSAARARGVVVTQGGCMGVGIGALTRKEALGVSERKVGAPHGLAAALACEAIYSDGGPPVRAGYPNLSEWPTEILNMPRGGALQTKANRGAERLARQTTPPCGSTANGPGGGNLHAHASAQMKEQQVNRRAHTKTDRPRRHRLKLIGPGTVVL